MGFVGDGTQKAKFVGRAAAEAEGNEAATPIAAPESTDRLLLVSFMSATEPMQQAETSSMVLSTERLLSVLCCSSAETVVGIENRKPDPRPFMGLPVVGSAGLIDLRGWNP